MTVTVAVNLTVDVTGSIRLCQIVHDPGLPAAGLTAASVGTRPVTVSESRVAGESNPTKSAFLAIISSSLG